MSVVYQKEVLRIVNPANDETTYEEEAEALARLMDKLLRDSDPTIREEALMWVVCNHIRRLDRESAGDFVEGLREEISWAYGMKLGGYF